MQLRRDRTPTQYMGSSKRNKDPFFALFFRSEFFFRLWRDRNPTHSMVRANETKISFLLFFQHLSPISNYTVAVILHNIWFKQTKKKNNISFPLPPHHLRLRKDNRTYYMVRESKSPSQKEQKIGFLFRLL